VHTSCGHGRYKTTKLGQPGKAGEVRRPLLDEGLTALVALLALVEQHGGVACQLLQTSLAILCGIHGRLDQPQGCWTVSEHLPAPGCRNQVSLCLHRPQHIVILQPVNWQAGILSLQSTETLYVNVKTLGWYEMFTVPCRLPLSSKI
jgi:hypothetical protein